MYPTDIKYHPEHTWVKFSGTTATIGISYFAQQSLGTVTFIDLPDAGARVTADAVFGSVESVKAINDLYSPVTGEVTDVNEALFDTPELVNSAPYGDGWMIKVNIAPNGQSNRLLAAEEYTKALE